MKRVVKLFVFVLIMSFMLFGFVSAVTTVPVVEGECPQDCWLNIGGSCTCPDVDSSNDNSVVESYTDDYDVEAAEKEYETDYYKKYEEYEGDKVFDVDAGSTPDDFFYFVDDFVEGVFIGDNPERALDYKEEKIAEAIVMVEEGMPEEAEKVLEKAKEYNEIIEAEVTPELEERIEESSIQVQTVLLEIEEELAGEEGWEKVIEKVTDTFEDESKIRTASEIAAKINELCAELAELDPIQYARTCKTGADAPKWMRERDIESGQVSRKERQKSLEI